MKKISILLLIVIIGSSLILGGCSLFGGDKDSGDGPDLSKMTYYVPGDYFVTNVKDSEKLSKTAIGIAMTKDETDFLTSNNDLIRDTVVKILRSHTEEELMADNSVDMLSEEITAKIKEVLGLDEIYYVYISDFVVQ